MLSNDAAAYDSFCDAIHSEETQEPTGPATSFIGDTIFAATRASVCTAEHHEHLKATAWESLAYVGIQGGELEMRNCVCGSTLCKPLPVVRFWLCQRDLCARLELTSGLQVVVTLVCGDRPYFRDWDDEELALFAWNAIHGGSTMDRRFVGWDDTEEAALDASDAAWDALTEAA